MTFILGYLLIGALLTIAINPQLSKHFKQMGGESIILMNVASVVLSPIFVVILLIKKLFGKLK
ncbi:UNVERIFIED_ORG: hypothetical protein GCAPEGMB_00098 [Vibrio phage V07]|uniref:Uncharacterized protein n=1 Tax=Vibrio phage V09 TaxID=2724327 RepID=A0A6H0X9C8_9CAUD|nr:hypothetical protein COHAPHLL_00121 [Vibrio phage V09]